MCRAHFVRSFTFEVRTFEVEEAKKRWRNYRVPTHFCGVARFRFSLKHGRSSTEGGSGGRTTWSDCLDSLFRSSSSSFVPTAVSLSLSPRGVAAAVAAVDTWATPQGSSDPFILAFDGEYCFSKPIPAAGRRTDDDGRRNSESVSQAGRSRECSSAGGRTTT